MKSRLEHPAASPGASNQIALTNILPRKILYLGFLLVTTLAWSAFCAPAAAQEERPQIAPGERTVPRKKDAGPRALALVKISDGKTSLIPIAILVNGKFWDATAYKATPVPMALETGIVYEAEHTGNSVGLFTVSSALHSNAVNAAPWIATGQWLPTGKDAPNQPLKAENAPVGIDTSNSDEPPRLTKNPQAVKNPPATAPPASSLPPSSPPPSSSPPSNPSGDEPPRLMKPPQSESKPDTKPADAPPADSKKDSPDDAKKDAGPKAPASDSGATQGHRPELRRGKPTGALPDEEIPGYSKPGATPSATATKDATKDAAMPAPADQGPVQLIPAISDATGPELHSFTFHWLPDEENDRRKQMTELAKTELRAYLAAQGKASITPAGAGLQAKHAPTQRAQTKKAPELILENAQMVAYDLWTTNQPVILFAADAHVPPPAGSPQAAADSQIQYTIMLVARTDIYGDLHKLYVGITDKYHLDLTPRFELIDAVDADGDGRGELLFRQTSDAGTGWLIYKASADKLWKMYDSLHPE